MLAKSRFNAIETQCVSLRMAGATVCGILPEPMKLLIRVHWESAHQKEFCAREVLMVKNFIGDRRDYGSAACGASLTPTPTTTTTPTLNQDLAVIYADAEQKISAAAKRKKNSSKDKDLLARFKGEFPPTLAAIMSGQGTDEDVGSIRSPCR